MGVVLLCTAGHGPCASPPWRARLAGSRLPAAMRPGRRPAPLDSRPAAATAAAPSLHGAGVLSGTYRLPGPGLKVVTLPLKGQAPAGDIVLAATAAPPGGPWGYAPVTVALSGTCGQLHRTWRLASHCARLGHGAAAAGLHVVLRRRGTGRRRQHPRQPAVVSGPAGRPVELPGAGHGEDGHLVVPRDAGRPPGPDDRERAAGRGGQRNVRVLTGGWLHAPPVPTCRNSTRPCARPASRRRTGRARQQARRVATHDAPGRQRREPTAPWIAFSRATRPASAVTGCWAGRGWRHGPGLPGRVAGRPDGGGQADPSGARRDPALPRAVRPGDRGGPAGRGLSHRARGRRRPTCRPALDGHRLHRGTVAAGRRQPVRADAAGPPASPGCWPGRRPRRHPRQWTRAPRPQAS